MSYCLTSGRPLGPRLPAGSSLADSLGPCRRGTPVWAVGNDDRGCLRVQLGVVPDAQVSAADDLFGDDIHLAVLVLGDTH